MLALALALLVLYRLIIVRMDSIKRAVRAQHVRQYPRVRCAAIACHTGV